MKKHLFIFAAAAAVLAGCSKGFETEDPSIKDGKTVEETTEVPDGSFLCSFAMNGEDETKTTISASDNKNWYLINWEKGDTISVTRSTDGRKEEFTAQSSGAEVLFRNESVTDFFVDNATYTATYGKTKSEKSNSYEVSNGSAEHIYMTATCYEPHRKFVFHTESNTAFLAVQIPDGVSAKGLKVINDKETVATLTSKDGNDIKAFYVPVAAGDHKFQIEAYQDAACSTIIAESMKMFSSQTLAADKIYPFTFTPTLKVTGKGKHSLQSYPGDYKVWICNDDQKSELSLTDIADSITVTYADGAAQHPANVYVDAKGSTVAKLVINTTDSHVEISNGESTKVTSKTSNSTFVVKPTYNIKESVTVQAGSITVEGNDGKKNVDTVILAYPDAKAMAGVVVSVTKVTVNNPVLIKNKTKDTQATPITVVGFNNSDSLVVSKGGFRIENGKTQNIIAYEKAVAKIGDTVYTTLDSAVTAAKAGETIVLIDDITRDNQPRIKVTKSIDINFNGHTITNTSEDEKGYVIVYDGESALPDRISGKVYGGTIYTNKCGIYAADHADLVVEDMTVVQTTAQDPTKFNHVALAVSYASTLTVKSGSYTGTRAVGIFSSGGIARIEGGTFVGTEYAFEVYPNTSTDGYSPGNSELHVSGGKVSGDYSLPDEVIEPYERIVSFTGGTFSVDPKAYVASGYVANGSQSGWYTIQPKTNVVAVIGTAEYATLAEAFVAVKENETIRVVADCETGSDYDENTPLSLTVANVTLDLDGHTVTETNNFSFVIAADGVTVKNGKVCSGYNSAKNCKYNSYAIVVGAINEGDKITGVKIKDVTFKGGISVGGSTNNNPAACEGSASATIENCTVTSGDFTAIYVQPANSDATVLSGCYKTYGSSSLLGTEGEGSAIYLKGGVYSASPDAKYIADGYQVLANTDATTKALYPYAVVEDAYVAEYNSTKYETLEAAFDAANQADGKATVKMLKNCQLAEGNTGVSVNDGKDITLDLNGCTVKNLVNENDHSYVIRVFNGGTFTVTDSGEGGKITNELKDGVLCGHWNGRNYYTDVILNEGTLNVEGGTVQENYAGGESTIGFAIDNNNNTGSAVTTISGGTVKNGRYAIRQFCQSETLENKVTVKNGTVSGAKAAIWTQLTSKDSNVNKKADVIIEGGTLSGDIHGMLVESDGNNFGNVNVTISGGTFEGDAPVTVCGGHLKVSGGTFKSGLRVSQYTRNEDGADPDSGVEFIRDYEVTGGTFNGLVYSFKTSTSTAETTDAMKFLKGGTYSADPSAYVSSGYHAVQNGGTWTVEKISEVAQIGETKYMVLADALKAAESGNTIEILNGTFGADQIGSLTTSEALKVRYKTLTIKAGTGASPVFTSDVYIGYDDSSTSNATISVSGLHFKNASLSLSNYVQATVESCNFEGSSSSLAGALVVMDACCTNHKTSDSYLDSKVTIKDCSINGTEQVGIRLRNSGNVTISGTTIANAKHNGILFEANGSIDNTPVKAVTITGCTISEWNASNIAEKGRAIRLSAGSLASGSTIDINNNTMTKSQLGLDTPDFIKITGSANASVNLNSNNWNALTLSDLTGDSKASYYTAEGTVTLDSVAN